MKRVLFILVFFCSSYLHAQELAMHIGFVETELSEQGYSLFSSIPDEKGNKHIFTKDNGEKLLVIYTDRNNQFYMSEWDVYEDKMVDFLSDLKTKGFQYDQKGYFYKVNSIQKLTGLEMPHREVIRIRDGNEKGQYIIRRRYRLL